LSDAAKKLGARLQIGKVRFVLFLKRKEEKRRKKQNNENEIVHLIV
jgi:hypothetical protein